MIKENKKEEKQMNVLSLFDGISCGMVALERAGVSVKRYIAYEIDKFAIETSKKNYPQIEHCGDVTTADFKKYKGFDLLIGGSPCTHWSIANAKRETEAKGIGFDLFMNYVRALEDVEPQYFLYENNYSISESIKKEISERLGVQPIMINSKDFSAQNRKRCYWTNIPVQEIKEKSQLVIKDIMETGVNEKYYMQYPLILKDGITRDLLQVGDIPKEALNDNERQRRVYSVDGKSPTILARADSPKILCVGTLKMKASQQIRRVYSVEGKSPTIDCATGGHRQIKIAENATVRKLTPLECERLQTLPDNYTDILSDTQRYKTIGNGWTVDVIAHIFKGLKLQEVESNV